MNRFPLGAAPMLILVLFVVSGAWLAFYPAPNGAVDADEVIRLRLDSFARPHCMAYQKAIPSFEAAHPGVKVEVNLVHARAVTDRLQAAFWADLDNVPDLVEVEISAAGTFFRGPLKDIGFLDLTERVHASGLYDKVVQTRFAPYITRGRMFGLPHDVHPVTIAYRRDIFEAEGINADELDTWDKFIEAGRKITRDLDGDGTIDRYMIELSTSTGDGVETMLFQRGGGYFNPQGAVVFDDETAVETMCRYIPLVAGPDRIANELGAAQILTQVIENGYVVCLLCPDWRSDVIEMDIPRVSGKMAMMPLPAPEPGGSRTSTWGGTMLGITKKCAHPDLAWELAQHLYYDADQLGERFAETNIVPPLREAWNTPEFSEPREYWSGQAIGEIYASVADQTPPQYTSPYITLAKGKLGEALMDCYFHFEKRGSENFEDFVRETLKRKADEVRAVMERNPFL